MYTLVRHWIGNLNNSKTLLQHFLMLASYLYSLNLKNRELSLRFRLFPLSSLMGSCSVTHGFCRVGKRSLLPVVDAY